MNELNLRFLWTPAFIEKLINFIGKNYIRPGLGFFNTFNVSTLVAWSEEKDITDLLSGRCPQIIGFVKDALEVNGAPKKMKQLVQTVSDADKIVWKYEFVKLSVKVLLFCGGR
jgi:hypothetical protein